MFSRSIPHILMLTLTIVGALGCAGAEDPCPPGSIAVGSQDRCLARSSVMTPDASDDRGPPDAQILPDATMADAAVAPIDKDAEVESDSSVMDASQQDADVTADAEAPAPVCSATDLTAWKAYHQQEDLVASFVECSKLECTQQSCPAQTCVRAAAGVSGCGECPELEAACVRVHCFSACGEPGSDRECLACMCEAGCVESFETCAGESTALCSENFHGQDLPVDDLTLAGPMLVRMKPETGLLNAAAISTLLPASQAFSFSDHQSTGFGLLASFSHHGRSYLIEHKNDCADTPCLTRISVMSKHGALGHPVYLEAWSHGWDKLATFVLGQDAYLVRYKTGAISADVEPKGHLRIERIVFDASERTATLEPVLDEQATPIFGGGWSALETLAIDKTPHLLTYGTERTGELTFWRIQELGGKVTRTQVSNDLTWPRGYDVFDTFQANGRTFIAAYASGRAPVTDVPVGHGSFIEPLVVSATEIALNTAVFEGDLGPGLTHIVGFQRLGSSALLRFASATGEVSIVDLPSDPSAWASQPWRTAYGMRWGARPQWKLVEVIKPNAWGGP